MITIYVSKENLETKTSTNEEIIRRLAKESAGITIQIIYRDPDESNRFYKVSGNLGQFHIWEGKVVLHHGLSMPFRFAAPNHTTFCIHSKLIVDYVVLGERYET